MMTPMRNGSDGVWREGVITERAFSQLVQQLPEQEKENGKDFLELLQMGITDVVFVKEGYHKQQSIALNAQLPEQHRATSCDLPAPVEVVWQLAVNTLDTRVQLSRELFGSRSRSEVFLSRGISKRELAASMCDVDEEAYPLELTERCKLLEVQYIRKTYQQTGTTEDPDPFGEHATAAQPNQQQRFVLSVRLTLQKMGPMQQLTTYHPPHEEDSTQQRQPDHSSGSSLGNRDLYPHGLQQTWAQGYICSLEYPLFQLDSSDYIISAQIFDQGMQQWSTLEPKDPFTMLWDGNPFSGYALEFRQRALDDPFHGSPWRSIAVDWEGQAVDRENDPEDWCYGNPWEMIRPEGYVPDSVPEDLGQSAVSFSSAQAATEVAQMHAPWTAYGAAAAAAVNRFTSQKRKRQRRPRKSEQLSDDYEDHTILESDMFYYDDDPDDFLLDDDHSLRRRRHKQQQRRAHGTARTAARAAGVSAVSFAKRSNAAAEAADSTEPKHNFGREMLGVPDGVCLVCRQRGGDLVTGHSGRASQSCSRYYHVGCLLLLNALGVRCIGQSKQQQRQQQQPPSAEELASVQCDGLLQQLRQLQQDQPELLSPAAAAAVAEATEAAALHQQKQFDVSCPAHYCHGCGLNGKHEHMVWCCCCLVHVYHNRNCIPPGAEAVEINGRDYIKCPACVAAGLPERESREQQLTAAPAAAAAAAADPVQTPNETEIRATAAKGRQQRSRRRAAASHTAQEQQQEVDGVSVQEQQQQQGAEPCSDVALPQTAAADANGACCQSHLAVAAPNALPSPIAAAEPADGVASSGDAAEQERSDDVVFVREAKAASGAVEAAAAADDDSSRRPSPDAATPEQQLQQLEQIYQNVMALQQQYEQRRSVPPAGVTEEGAAAATEQPAEPPGPSAGRSTRSSSRQQKRTPQADAAASEPIPSSSNKHNSALDALMPAWLKLSLNDSERLKPSYRLVALADGSETSSAPAAAAAALRHVAAAATRMPHHVETLSESATHLDLCSPQSHWLIGSADKAESAKFKVTGSWTGCPVIEVPTPDDGVFGLCLVVDHYGLLDEQQEQHQQEKGQGKGHSRANASSTCRRGRSTATEAQQQLEAAATTASEGFGVVRRRPGVYLRCWRPVMQGKLEKQQQLLQLQQSGDEKGGSAYQVLVNDVPFPERLGRQDMQLQPGDVLVIQGRRFQLTAVQH